MVVLPTTEIIEPVYLNIYPEYLQSFQKTDFLISMKEIFIFCVNKYNEFIIVTIFRLFMIYNNLIVIVVLYSFA